MENFYDPFKRFLLLCTVLLWPIFVQAQPAVGRWEAVNDGFGKCALMGQSGTMADWAKDDFVIIGMTHMRNQSYVMVRYGGAATNTQPCNAGLFMHDTLTQKWIRVANDFPEAGQTGRFFFLSNGQSIFYLVRGRVYEHTRDYAQFPNGWKLISRAPNNPLTYPQIFPSSCGLVSNGSADFNWRTSGEAAIGDTIFVMFNGSNTNNCLNNPRIGKFSIRSGNWTIQELPTLPYNSAELTITDKIGGLFQYFIRIQNVNNPRACYPDFVQVYDPRSNTWRVITQGLNLQNLTGTANSEDPTCPTHRPSDPPNNWVAPSRFHTDFERKRVFVTTQQGSYEWKGSGWFQITPYMGSLELITSKGIIYRLGGSLNLYANGNTLPLNNSGDANRWCPNTAYENIMTPDDGRTFYATQRVRNPLNCNATDLTDPWNDVRISRYRSDPSTPQKVRNLTLESGTYLGSSAGSNDPVNTVIAGQMKHYVGGNFTTVQPGGGYPVNFFNGAAPTDRAKIIVLNKFGTGIDKVAVLGGSLDVFEGQNFGELRMVAAGSFGVMVFDSTLTNVLWSKPLSSPDLPAGPGEIRVDIDDNGHVVFMRNKNFRVFNEFGNPIAPIRAVPGTFVNDVAIRNDTIWTTGFNNANETMTSPCADGPNGSSFPVQISAIRCYTLQAGTYEQAYLTFGFSPNQLDADMADTRGYRINIGKDGKLYFLGEAAGGNSIFRWDGKVTKKSSNCNVPASSQKLITYDNFNLPVNTASAHLAYLARINPRDGVIEMGQYIIPRLSSGLSNAFRVRDGYVHADENGLVYVCGASTANMEGRTSMFVNGRKVGNYSGGDMALLANSSDFRTRIFWGTFSDSLGNGVLRGVGLRSNIVSAVGEVTRGTMFVGNQVSGQWTPSAALNSSPFHLDYSNTNANNDTWFGIWYRDMWNHTKPNIEVVVIPGEPVIPPNQMNCGANFVASSTTICAGEPVIITNTSECDTLARVWDFGEGASLPEGTTGTGPFTITYSTPGMKTIRLNTPLTNGVANSQKIRFEYIRVLPNPVTLPQLLGPSTGCAGAVVTFRLDADSVTGLSAFEWELPAGAVILAGAGGPQVQVRLGNNSGLVRVRGIGPCGYSLARQISFTVNTPSESRVLFVVRNTSSLSSGDNNLRNRILNLGYTITLGQDSTVTAADAGCVRLVVISASARAARVNTAFRDVATPVVVCNPALYPFMAMTNGGTNDFGTTASQNQVNVLTVTPELGANLAGTGNRTVYSSNQILGWGRPNANAIAIGVQTTETLNRAFFGYDRGVQMVGLNAPHRRVGLFLSEAGAGALAAQGDSMFRRAICWSVGNCPTNRTLTTGVLSNNNVCPGANIRVPFTVGGGNLTTGATVTAQLSDQFGNFANATVIGSKQVISSDTIVASIPVSTVSSFNYRVRVVASSPSITAAASTTILSVQSQQAGAGPVSGPDYLCQGDTSATFSVAPVAGAISYQWTIPGGALITNGIGTNQVTVFFERLSGVRTVSVRVVGPCGISPTSSAKNITLNQLLPGAIASIGGDTILCSNASNIVYTAAPALRGERYVWDIPSGFSLHSGSDTTSIIRLSVNSLPNGSVRTLRVRAENLCGLGPETSLVIKIDNAASIPTLGAISGTDPFCALPREVEYTVTPIAGALNYNWTLPANASGTSTSNRIRVTYTGASVGNISVTAETNCGNTNTVTRAVNIPAAGNEAFLVVGNSASLNASDTWLKDKLEALGYTVVVKDDSDPVVPEIECKRLVLIAGSCVPTTLGSKYQSAPVPLLVCNRTLQQNMGMCTGGGLQTGYASLTILDVFHPIRGNLTTGSQTIFTGNSNISYGTGLTDAAVRIANLNAQRGNAGINYFTIYTYSAGDDMPALRAPAIRVGLFIDNNANLLTAVGEGLFERSVCFTQGNCNFNQLTVLNENLGSQCVQGNQVIKVQTLGTYEPDNQLILEMAHTSVNFAPASTFTLGTISAANAGAYEFNVIWPNGSGSTPSTSNTAVRTVTGSGYNLRIRSTNPAQTSVAAAGTVSFSTRPANPSVISGPTQVCVGQEVTYSISTTANKYRWILPNGVEDTTTQAPSAPFGRLTITWPDTMPPGTLTVWTMSGGADCNSYQSSSITITAVERDNYWVGTTNDWSDPANWSCGIVPLAGSNVVIPGNPSGGNFPVLSANATCTDLTILSNGQFTINAASTLTIRGNLTNAGTFTATDGEVLFTGTNEQTVVGNFNFNNVRINKERENVVLSGTHLWQVAGNIVFEKGRFIIGQTSINLTGEISGASIENYFATNGTNNSGGFLRRNVPEGSVWVDFPVGTLSRYSPLRIRNSGTASVFEIRTFGGVFTNGNTGLEIQENLLAKTWEITPLTAGAVADLDFTWYESEQRPSFNRFNARVIKNEGGEGAEWIPVSSSSVSGIDPFNIMATGIASFSKFTITSEDEEPLPLTLLGFRASLQNDIPVLLWSTTFEKNINTFEVERSSDGRYFDAVGTVKAIGQSAEVHNYRFKDSPIFGRTYYRLKIWELDGTYTFSPIVTLIPNNSVMDWSMEFIPNPFNSVGVLSLTNADESLSYQVMIQDVVGKQIFQSEGSIETINIGLQKLLPQLRSGVYNITLSDGEHKAHKKIVKR